MPESRRWWSGNCREVVSNRRHPACYAAGSPSKNNKANILLKASSNMQVMEMRSNRRKIYSWWCLVMKLKLKLPLLLLLLTITTTLHGIQTWHPNMAPSAIKVIATLPLPILRVRTPIATAISEFWATSSLGTIPSPQPRWPCRLQSLCQWPCGSGSKAQSGMVHNRYKTTFHSLGDEIDQRIFHKRLKVIQKLPGLFRVQKRGASSICFSSCCSSISLSWPSGRWPGSCLKDLGLRNLSVCCLKSTWWPKKNPGLNSR